MPKGHPKKPCCAKTRQGNPCKRAGHGRGGRCRFHGGASTGPPKGNQNGRRTGLYARHLPQEQLEAFDLAKDKLGSVEEELRLARANLDWALKMWAKDKTGGVVTARGDKSITERLWTDIVREHMDIVRKFELAHQQLGGGDDDSSALRDFLSAMGVGKKGQPPSEDGDDDGNEDEETEAVPTT